MTPDEARESIVMTLVRQGITETDLAQRGLARIGAPVSAVDVDLPKVVDVVPKSLLGRGGMGIVHAAEQRSLARDVAVKTIAKPDDGRRRALVLEGRTMGALEHPNIVPVHALGVDDAGEPVLVMKLVDGVSWRALLDDPKHPWWSSTIAPDGDRLRASVEILTSVCRALSFAHSKGVVHRDLKPDNVMLGRFGEVYLLDWGIALALTDRAQLPPGVAGTPGYLAPEMARGNAREIDERTDVYLLGATLFELLAGHPPHRAPTSIASLVSSLLANIPALPDDTPPDLAALVRASLDGDPAKRPASAEAFRAALAAHVTVVTLFDGADAAMARANDAIGREGPSSSSGYRALVEARFALRSILDIKPDDATALARSDACIRRLVERELALQSPISAREAAAELRSPDAALVARIAALESSSALEKSAAEQARAAAAKADISSAWRAIAVIGSVLVLFMLPFSMLNVATMTASPFLWLFVVGSVATTAAGLAFNRKKLFATVGSRRLTAFITVYALYWFPGVVIALLRSAPVDMPFEYCAGGLVTIVGAITVLPRLWPLIFLQFASAAADGLWPNAQNIVAPLFLVATLAIFVAALRHRNLELQRGRLS